MELESEEEEIAMANGGWGFLRYSALEGRRVCDERSRFEMRLNSENWKWIGGFTFNEEPVAETLRLPWQLQCDLMSINGNMKQQSGFGIIITKTRGHVLSP